MKNNTIFWIFGIIQAASLGFIIFFILQSLGSVGEDTQIMLSIIFPLFLLMTEYTIYSKK